VSYRGHGGFSYGQIRKAQRVHARRSNRAKRIDESLRAPIAKTPEQWLQQPNSLTFQTLTRQIRFQKKNRTDVSQKLIGQKLTVHVVAIDVSELT
jgi:hypothetical protein